MPIEKNKKVSNNSDTVKKKKTKHAIIEDSSYVPTSTAPQDSPKHTFINQTQITNGSDQFLYKHVNLQL